MNLEIDTKFATTDIQITNLDRRSAKYGSFAIDRQWYKITIPSRRDNIIDIKIDGESIRQCLNAGVETDNGYELWIHGDLSELFSRISDRIAQDDVLRFIDLRKKYLITESWNEYVEGDYIPNSVKNFFANGQGPRGTEVRDERVRDEGGVQGSTPHPGGPERRQNYSH